MNSNLNKLYKMRLIATSLLVIMAVTYIIFKGFESKGLFFSSIAAFSEAALIGALADWFAVVALFRHPLGLKWIPHTAIIQNNKKRIGDALSNFVVSNFFTEETIKKKLEGLDLTAEIIQYLNKNKRFLSARISEFFPQIIQPALGSERLNEFAAGSFNGALRNVKLCPLLGRLVILFHSSGYHRYFLQEILIRVYRYISMHKDETMNFLEGLNKSLTFPLIGDMIYKNILKAIMNQIEDIENNESPEIIKILDNNIPLWANRLMTDSELIEKGEKIKDQILESDIFEKIINDELAKFKTNFSNNLNDYESDIQNVMIDLIDRILESIFYNDEVKAKVDNRIKDGIAKLVYSYRREVAMLIDDTVEGWDSKDLSDKLELQVGADLQYIRINGTVIGGMAGLAIHLLTHLIM